MPGTSACCHWIDSRTTSTFRRFAVSLYVVGLLAAALPAPAQWVTQSISLKSGWNAVYLHVDPSYDTLDNQIAADATGTGPDGVVDPVGCVIILTD